MPLPPGLLNDTDHHGGTATPPPARAWLAGAMVTGILLGWLAPWLGLWLVAGGLGGAAAIGMHLRGRPHRARAWGLLAAMALAAAWLVLRTGYTSPDDLSRFIHQESVLAEVVATVATPPRIDPLDDGPFAPFHWAEPVTRFRVDASSILVGGEAEAASGGLLVRVGDTSLAGLRVGQRVRLQGWLGPIEGPLNPGEFDFRAAMDRRGIVGRMSLETGANALPLDAPLSPAAAWSRLRWAAASAADASLSRGLDGEPEALALLRALLLGQTDDDLRPIEAEFRRAGLSHVLAM